MLARFDDRGRHPRSVVVVRVAEVYSPCARALMRPGVWAGVDDAGNLPTIGELLAEAEAKARFDGASYDDAWAARAQKTMW
jgi:hypothetical protein